MRFQPSQHILVVEDDADIREILVEQLGKLDCTILEAANGREGFERLRVDSKIIAIVSDIQMPVMTGLEMLALMRQSKYETPVVFLSGYIDKEKAMQAMNLRAMDMIEKPFDTQTLLNTVKRAAILGQSLKTLDAEVNELCKQCNVPEARRSAFIQEQREILKMKKLTEAIQKSKSS